jgi:hypothetical protein
MIQHIKESVTLKYEIRIIENTVETVKDENKSWKPDEVARQKSNLSCQFASSWFSDKPNS